MNDSTLQILTLEEEIHQMEAKVSALLEEELRQKSDSEQLQLQIISLQEKLRNGNNVTSQVEAYYVQRLDFLDQRINNHQNTLQKYKDYYEILHGKGNSQLSNCQNQFYSNRESNGYYIAQQRKQNQMKQSVLSMRSNNSRINENDRKKSINVVCEVQCENCGKHFKPYHYYSHVNSCQKNILIDSKICSSDALGMNNQ